MPSSTDRVGAGVYDRRRRIGRPDAVSTRRRITRPGGRVAASRRTTQVDVPWQAPPEQTSVVQATPSLQGAVLFVNTQPVLGEQVSSVHALSSLHTGGVPAVQVPALARLRAVADVAVAARRAVRGDHVRRTRRARPGAGLRRIACARGAPADRARGCELTRRRAAGAAVARLAALDLSVAAQRVHRDAHGLRRGAVQLIGDREHGRVRSRRRVGVRDVRLGRRRPVTERPLVGERRELGIVRARAREGDRERRRSRSRGRPSPRPPADGSRSSPCTSRATP